MTDATAVLLASAISAGVAMIVVGLQNSLERRRRERRDRIERLAAFFSAAHAVAIGIVSVALAPKPHKAETESEVRAALSDRYNSLFSQLRLQENEEVVLAASRIDAELVRLTESASSRQWSRAEWHPQREALAHATAEFEAVARSAMGFSPLKNASHLYMPLTSRDSDLSSG